MFWLPVTELSKAAAPTEVSPTPLAVYQRKKTNCRARANLGGAGVVTIERLISHGHIEASEYVAIKRRVARGYIPATDRVAEERLAASSHVVMADVASVLIERLKTGSRV